MILSPRIHRTASLWLLAGGALVILWLGGCAVGQAATTPTSTTPTATAATRLAQLTVADQPPTDGYSPGRFGKWQKSDAPDCDMRDAMLDRDGANITYTGRSLCDVAAGEWESRYDGEQVTSAANMTVDHVVPLANAWQSGANRWPASKRAQFFNDPVNLLSVSKASAQAKGDQGPDQWKPIDGQHCYYAQTWITIKAKYGLAITPAEKTALGDMLSTCEGAAQ